MPVLRQYFLFRWNAKRLITKVFFVEIKCTFAPSKNSYGIYKKHCDHCTR